jgi:hypothetical protein
VVAGR